MTNEENEEAAEWDEEEVKEEGEEIDPNLLIDDDEEEEDERDYPMGGVFEPYDIWKDFEMMRSLERKMALVEEAEMDYQAEQEEREV